MSSPEKEYQIFLPSMMRKNAGKFGETLGNALMNKFTPPTGQRKSQPEIAQPDSSTETTESSSTFRSTSNSVASTSTSTLTSTVTSKEDSTDSFLQIQTSSDSNTLDRVGRLEILKDVRSTRVKSPSTRPKSMVRLLSNEEDSELKNAEPEPEKTTTETVVKSSSVSISDTSNFVTKQRQFVARTRTERPASIGTMDKELIENLTKVKATDEVDSTVIGRRFGRDRNTSMTKSTEVLSSSPTVQTPSSTTTSVPVVPAVPVATTITPNQEKTIRGIKVHAVKLTTSIISMEKEIASMKAQLSNLITLIGEFETDKK